MTILGIEHAAAVRRTNDLSLYLGELETSRRRAQDLGRLGDVEQINSMIRSVSIDYQDTQAVIEAFERQEDEREALRLGRQYVRERIGEQLMLSARPRAVGVL